MNSSSSRLTSEALVALEERTRELCKFVESIHVHPVISLAAAAFFQVITVILQQEAWSLVHRLLPRGHSCALFLSRQRPPQSRYSRQRCHLRFRPLLFRRAACFFAAAWSPKIAPEPHDAFGDRPWPLLCPWGWFSLLLCAWSVVLHSRGDGARFRP